MPAHGSWTHCTAAAGPARSAASSGAWAVSVQTKPSAAPGSTISAPPATTASGSHERTPDGSRAMRGGVAMRGNVAPGHHGRMALVVGVPTEIKDNEYRVAIT